MGTRRAVGHRHAAHRRIAAGYTAAAPEEDPRRAGVDATVEVGSDDHVVVAVAVHVAGARHAAPEAGGRIVGLDRGMRGGLIAARHPRRAAVEDERRSTV